MKCEVPARRRSRLWPPPLIHPKLMRKRCQITPNRGRPGCAALQDIAIEAIIGAWKGLNGEERAALIMGKTVAIIDFGAGNLRSVLNAIRALGHHPELTTSPDTVREAALVILPGVGAAADTMQSLYDWGLHLAIRERTDRDRPFFGVCIGLQVLFSRTEEGGGECLGVIPGQVKRLPAGIKVPHMGWNQVRQRVPHPIYQGIPDDSDFYFVHSYYGVADDAALAAGKTDYGLRFASVVARGSLVATQFHPERSGALGLQIYDNFIRAFGA